MRTNAIIGIKEEQLSYYSSLLISCDKPLILLHRVFVKNKVPIKIRKVLFRLVKNKIKPSFSIKTFILIINCVSATNRNTLKSNEIRHGISKEKTFS